MTGIEPILGGQGAAAVIVSGDVDCDGTVEVDDALLVLQSTASVSANADCMAQASNVDCSVGTDVVDALLTLKYVAHLHASPAAGCPPVGYLTAGTPPGDAAVALAQRVTDGYDLGVEVTAVNDAFSYAGVGVGSEGDLVVEARPPQTEQVVTLMEALQLALEARDRASVYRISADELGQILADFGWPFGDGSTPGEQFAAFIREWVTEAQMDPQEPRDFVPLFLAEMAERGEPPVDLSTEVPPGEMVFSTLEVELILAEFDRETDPAPEADAGFVQPQAVTPCNDAKKYISDNLGPFAGQLTGVAVSEGVSQGLEKGLVKAGVSSSTASDFSTAISSVAIIARLWKLVAFYSDSQVNVTIDGDNPQHKRPESEPGPLLKLLHASAGVSEEDWRAYQETYGELGVDANSAVRDCLSQAGIPTLADLGEIANDAENWAVEWYIYAAPGHAIWSPDQQVSDGAAHLGHWRSNLRRPPGNDYSAETNFIVEIPGEDKDTNHPGSLNDAPVKVCAAVDASQPPSLGTFVNAAKGILGLADAIAEIASGWLLQMVKPTSCGLLTVTWHESCASVSGATETEASPALQPQPGESASIEAITSASSVDELPCGWQGTISTSRTEEWQSGNRSVHKSLTMSGQLVWKRRDLDDSIGEICESQSPPCVVYHASGTVEWRYTYSATNGDIHCEDDQSGAFEVAPPDRLENWWQNNLTVRPTDSGITYKGEGNYYQGDTPAGISSACEGDIQFDPWLETNFDTPSTDRQTIQGAIIIPLPDPPGRFERHWDFHATSCNPTPEPVCQ